MHHALPKLSHAIFAVASLANAPIFVQSQPLNQSAHEAMQRISVDSLYQHIKFLGRDSLAGRGTGTRGGELAAAYIANELRKHGIKPAGGDNSYFQQIPMHGSKPLTSSSFQLITPNGEIELELGKDYLLYNTGAQTFIPKPAPLVFAGYGITAPEFDYDDYQALSVEGKIVVFLFATGEEKGLLGSSYYVDHPVAPLYKTIANVNVDGLAMFDTFDDIAGVGVELSTLGDLLEQIAGELGLRVSPIPAPFLPTVPFARSDQISFAQAGIPSLLIMEGSSYRHTGREEGLQRMIAWGQRIYHTPFDDLQQTINLEAAQQHAQILLAFCCALANLDSAPQWKKGAPYINARLQSTAEKR